MKNLIVRFVRDEEGASAAEYAILLALIGTVIVVAATTLQGAISGALTTCADTINGAS